jgi:hypothetical protein
MPLSTVPDTKSPTEIAKFSAATLARMGFGQSEPLIARLVADVTRLFTGQHPDYQALDMQFHNYEHTLQVTVCACQMLEGRHAAGVLPRLGRRECESLLAAVLLHDTGYVKRREEATGTGARFTFVHEQRSCEFAERYLPSVGFSTAEIAEVTAAIRCTGPQNKIAKVLFPRPEARVVATLVVTADYLGQMAAPDYVDKLPALFREFEEANDFNGVPRSQRLFQSTAHLIRATPTFWEKFVLPMLDRDLDGVYGFIPRLPDGTNPCLKAVEANLARIRALAAAPDISLDPFPAPTQPEAKA